MKKFICKIIMIMMVASIIPMVPTTATSYAAMDVTIEIPIDEVHFPDLEFRKELKWNYDKDRDGKLNFLDLSVEEMYFSSCDITDITGIKYFETLKELSLDSTTTKGWSDLPASLEKLTVHGDALTSSITLPSNLKELVVSGGTLTSYPTFPNRLETIKFYECKLATLPTLPNGLKSLEFDYYDNDYEGYVTSLPTLPNTLETLKCSFLGLTSLPTLPNSLKELQCSYNNLTSLPALPPNLEDLCVDGNYNLTTLPELPATLEDLSFYETKVASVPALPDGLRTFRCGYSSLTSLPTMPPALEELVAYNCNISGILDVSQSHLLKDLRVQVNSITGVKLNAKAPYEKIVFRYNMMNSTADVTGRSDIPWDVESEDRLFVFGEQKTNCQHDWYTKAIHKKATCTTEGSASYYCNRCLLTKTESLPKVDHSFTAYSVIEKAGFNKEGKQQATCTVCQTKTTKAIPAAVVPVIKDQTFNNKKKTPKVIVKDTEGNTISSVIVYPNKKRTAVGTYNVIVDLKDDMYSGSKTLTFKIKPKTPTIIAPKAAKKAVSVKWKKGKKAQVTGYQVMVASNSKFTKNAKTVNLKGYKLTSKKVSKLKAKTKYFVKVRTYKTVKGVKIYSDWSKVKTVRTK